MPLNTLHARIWAQTYNFVCDAIKILQICYSNIFPLDDSVVLKVITIYNKDTDTTEEVLLEELQVFKVCYFSLECVWVKVALSGITVHRCCRCCSYCIDTGVKLISAHLCPST